jgi:hypothetical protein
MMNRFSPSFVSTLLVKPLRYFFENYAGSDYRYSDDPKETKIEIASANNYFRLPLQEQPRIIVDRGDFVINGVGLSDNLAESDGTKANLGLTNRTNFVLISGTAQITVQSRNEGTCELITDMVSHFFIWSRPLICDTQGFKQFAQPVSVSRCQQTKDDTEVLENTISFPWMMEEAWTVRDDALKLKSYYMNMSQS